MKVRKVTTFFLVLLFCLNFNLLKGWPEELYFEKYYGNVRFLYAVPQDTKGPFTLSDFPMNFERTFKAPIDKLWNALEKLASVRKAVFIVKDQPSGMMVFRYDEIPDENVLLKDIDPISRTLMKPTTAYYSTGIPPEFRKWKIYFNVYLKPAGASHTVVYATYFIPVTKRQYKYLDTEFFKELDTYVSGG